MTIISALAVMLCLANAGPQRKVVLIAGPKDAGHPAGTHEYELAVRLLKSHLDRSNVAGQIKAEIHFGGWPEDPETLDDADTIVLISSGGDRKEADHPLLVGDRMQVIARQMTRGCGLVFIHWTTFIPNKHGEQALDWVGGYFDYQGGPAPRGWFSKIQTHTTKPRPGTPNHPICRGMSPFELREEYYYNIRFRPNDPRLVPVLVTPIPGEEKEQVVAWAVERADSGRGFGFTGGHFFANYDTPNFRRMILNAIVWTARAEVPEGGVASKLDQPMKAAIITGHQYPGHPWRETTPAIKEAILAAEPKCQLDVKENVEFLADAGLRDYDVLILNYCNWQQPAGLSAKARENFVSYLKSGGGLVLVHFANGAWHFSLPQAGESDWPEFRKICRRVWDHTQGKSGHDAYGPFVVDIADPNHPITAGMKEFPTTDELYFRQQGDEPIEVLATARSKITGQPEPMAFIYEYGKGRVFQTVLGHDAKSLRTVGAAALVGRGTVWAAGRPLAPLTNFKPVAERTLEPGKTGNAWNARSGYLEVEHRGEYQQPPFTVDGWVNVPSSQQFNIVAAKNPKSSSDHWEIYTYAGAGEFSVYLPGYEPAEIKSVPITDGKWHHVGMTFDGSEVQLFVDANQVKQTRVRRVRDGGGAGPLWIGAIPPGLGCDGLIDDLRIRKGIHPPTALPAGPAALDADTVGLWSFDALDGNKVADLSSSKNAAISLVGTQAGVKKKSMIP